MPIIAAIILIISAFVGGAYLNQRGEILSSSVPIKPVIEVTPTVTPLPTFTPTPTVSPSPTNPPLIYRPNPTATLIPTQTPNSGKEIALKAIEEKIARINQVIATWQAQIDNLIKQEEQQCGAAKERYANPESEMYLRDPYQRELAYDRCFQGYYSTISKIELEKKALVRERNELDRQKFSIMAQ